MNPYILPGTIKSTNIIEITCSLEFGFWPPLIHEKTKKNNIVEARQITMFLNHYYLGLSWRKSALRFKKDHATAIHAAKRVLEHLKYEKEYRKRFILICKRIGIEDQIINRLMDIE